MNPVWITYLFHCRIIPYGILEYVISLKENTLVIHTKPCGF